MLNNILYLNEKRLVCSFYNSFGENIAHLFCVCTITQCLWKNIQFKLKDDITLLPLPSQASIFGFLQANCQSYLIQNSILLSSTCSFKK